MAFRSLSCRMAALSASKRPGSPVEGSKSKKPFGHWSQGLLAAMTDPELKIEEDERVVIIKDKYPKARHHFLVMPKEKIPNLKSVKKEHLDLLKHMHKKGEEIADRASKELQFRFGYHAVPSMSHLHMHVISQDFVSDCLKNKKHWNSFTTAYFMDSKDIIAQLEKNGSVHITATADLLKEDLRCHVCKKPFATIPALKAHIALHNVTKSSKKKTS